MAVYSQGAVSVWGTGLSGGAPDSVRWCTGQCPVRQAGATRTGRSREIGRRRTAKIHRTVRCAPDCPVSQRSAARSARDTWPSQRSEGSTGLSGVHRTVRCAPDCPVRHRADASSQRSSLVVGAINTPTTPPFIASKFSSFQPLYKS